MTTGLIRGLMENSTRGVMGADLLSWIAILRANRFQISPSRLHLAALATAFSSSNLVFKTLNGCLRAQRKKRIGRPIRPVFIIGHWRSGTTLLHELMTIDPRNVAPTSWECVGVHMAPWISERSARFLPLRIPASRPFDNVQLGWESPQEDEFALCNLGVPSTYHRFYFPTTNSDVDRFLAIAKDTRVAPALSRFLDQLAWIRCVKRPRAGSQNGGPSEEPLHVVLKSPTHTWRVDELRRAFPDARFLHITRSPYEVYRSTKNLWEKLCAHQGLQRPRFSTEAGQRDLEDFVVRVFADMHQTLDSALESWRSDGDGFEQRYHQVPYEAIDPTRHPAPAVIDRLRSAYEDLGLHQEESQGALPADVTDRLGESLEGKSRYVKNRFDELPPTLIDRLNREWRGYFDAHEYAMKS
ncbi:MAG: sulfotransferase [Planctomycetota bacterium]